MVPCKSVASPHLPAGILSKIVLFLTGPARSAVVLSVAIYPGAMAFTFTPLPAHSLAKTLVNEPIAPLLAA